MAGRSFELPDVLPYRCFVAHSRQVLKADEYKGFFREMLAGVEETTAPFGLMEVHGDGTGVIQAHRVMEGSLAKRLRGCARVLGVSAASVFHVAWASVLSRASGREDPVFGTVVFGRMHGSEGVERVMGPFINTLPVRIGLSGVSVEECVRATHRLLAQLLLHEHAPLALAQRCSGVAAPMPLFSALLNYRYGQPAEASTALAWEGIESLGAQEHTNYPFVLFVDDLGEGFVLKAQTSVAIQARRVCDYMHTILKHLVDALEMAPDTAVNRIEVLPHAERRRLLVEWNDTRSPFPDRRLHQLVEAQVDRSPEAIALAGIGGFIGVVLGVGLILTTKVLLPLLPTSGFLSAFDPVLSTGPIAVAFGISLAIGLIAGGYPAWRAAQLNPIEALRYE